MRSCSTFGAQTSHEHTHIYKTHHGPYLGEATTFPLIVFSMLGHEGCTQMSFRPKFSKIGIFVTLEAHNFLCANV
jgi:hypothetical protein